MLLAAFFASVAALAPAPALPASTETIGTSAEGRPIRAELVGSRRARTKVLVVGSIHGNEPAGRAITRRLRRVRPPSGTALWIIDDANPDGSAADARHNAHGVDLNRNFPYRWQPQDGVYESGPGPASEPETQVLQRFIERERPRVTLWYHQALRMVVTAEGDPALERLYARGSGCRAGACLPTTAPSAPGRTAASRATRRSSSSSRAAASTRRASAGMRARCSRSRAPSRPRA